MSYPYACSVCGAEVVVSDNGDIHRACEHDGQTVIAERTSVLYGDGGATAKSYIDRVRDAINTLIKAFR